MSAIQKSKAKTAYGLLGEVCAVILAEPKRYNQRSILDTNVKGSDAPECGTVGCVAGLVSAMKPGRIAGKSVCGCGSRACDLDRAARVLGLDGNQLRELYDSGAAGPREGSYKMHARRGANHIEKFRQKYAEQLKAKAV